jgi:NH2-acetyltransferase
VAFNLQSFQIYTFLSQIPWVHLLFVSRGRQQMSGIFAVFTPDCVSFCEVSSHTANSKGRRLRFLGSHRRIVMLFYLILFTPDSFRNLFNQLELVPLLQPGQLVADLAGGKTTLRAQAEAVHFSASWMRAITVSLYTEEKTFTQEQVQQLFLSVGWVSGQYPQRLYKALMHSSTILIVWDGDKLVGLIRVLDDSEMLAQIHAVWRYFRQCGCRCRRLSGWSACF